MSQLTQELADYIAWLDRQLLARDPELRRSYRYRRLRTAIREAARRLEKRREKRGGK